MAKRSLNSLLSRSFQRVLTAMTRKAVRSGTKAVKQGLRSAKVASKLVGPPAIAPRRRVKKSTPGLVLKAPAKPLFKPVSKPAKSASKASASGTPGWTQGFALGAGGVQHYRLFQPPGLLRSECLPLMVMLHGCAQDGEKLAVSSQMNQLAARERFMVLYPEQDRLANAMRCWNWYDTRNGRAQGESSAIDATISHVCSQHQVDKKRIALAGFSAGAGMAALLASRHPKRFQAIAMHSGVGVGVAHSSASAIGAMRGRRNTVAAAAGALAGDLPGLLVIHGNADLIVAPSNAAQAAQQWAERSGAKAGQPRLVKRGARYAATITDWRRRGRLVATLCRIDGLGHAWSGGAAGRDYSDPKGPSASRMIWSFASKQFLAAGIS